MSERNDGITHYWYCEKCGLGLMYGNITCKVCKAIAQARAEATEKLDECGCGTITRGMEMIQVVCRTHHLHFGTAMRRGSMAKAYEDAARIAEKFACDDPCNDKSCAAIRVIADEIRHRALEERKR